MESETTKPCPVCGGKLIRVKLFNREWWECENSVMEFFDGMYFDDPTHEKFYTGATHFRKLPTTPEEVAEAEAYFAANPVEVPESLRDPMKVLEQVLETEKR